MIVRSSSRLAAAVLGIAVAAGCSGGGFPQSAAVRASSAGSLGPTRTAVVRGAACPPNPVPRVWVSDPTGNAVYGYLGANTGLGPCVVITSAYGANLARPRGIAVDHFKRLYVADSLNSRILVFNKYGAPINLWRDGIASMGYYPYGVSVSHNPNGATGQLVVAVTNLCANVSGGPCVSGFPGNVVFWKWNAGIGTGPTGGAPLPAPMDRGYFPAQDLAGNVYFTGIDSTGPTSYAAYIQNPNVSIFTNVATVASSIPLSDGQGTMVNIWSPSTTQRLNIVDNGCSCIRRYQLNIPTFTPDTSVPLVASVGNYYVGLDTNKLENRVYVANFGTNKSQRYPYPAGVTGSTYAPGSSSTFYVAFTPSGDS